MITQRRQKNLDPHDNVKRMIHIAHNLTANHRLIFESSLIMCITMTVTLAHSDLLAKVPLVLAHQTSAKFKRRAGVTER